jgi:hypothetical protein
MQTHYHTNARLIITVQTFIVLILLLVLPLSLPAQILTVKQDGTGMYMAIQEAIDAAVNGDTVLVWPGVYYENLDFKEKSLTLGSLTLTTGDIAYRNQTIIDGNYNGSCIRIIGRIGLLYPEFVINGFTLQHGNGFTGGCMRILSSKGSLIDCLIQDNESLNGSGGLSVTDTDLYLSNTIIRNNYSYSSGGGIGTGLSLIVFDSINRCSIYNNYGCLGSEIRKGNSVYPLNVYVDTFMVAQPDRYHIFAEPDSSGNTFTFDGWNHKVEQSAETLYVSPLGDNANSGLSSEEPLKNIWLALVKAKPAPGQPQTIRLSEGLYAQSANQERLPLGLKDSVSIVGAGKFETVIDAEYITHFVVGDPVFGPISLSSLSLINGLAAKYALSDGSIYVRSIEGELKFDSVRIENVTSFVKGGIFSQNVEKLFISSCNFSSIKGHPLVISNGDFNGLPLMAEVVNTIIENSLPPVSFNTPDHLYFNSIYLNTYYPYTPDNKQVNLINCQITDNIDSTNQGYVTRGAIVLNQVNANIINCSFANNRAVNSQWGASVNIQGLSTVNIYNSIFYQNQPTEFGFFAPEGNKPTVNIHNSLVLGGTNSFYDPGAGILHYDTSNIDTDPLFTGYGDFPYALSGLSPCIDAGTLELPEGITLPETDLAGNPRVWGGSVDMGAYEFNPVTIGESRLQAKAPARLVAAPNPFTHELSLTITPKTGVPVRITVHNLLGREVARLLDQTDNRLAYTTLQWNGRGSAGEDLPAGAYIISLVENGKEVESLRVVKSER